jgi:acyl carrier protein
MDNIELAIQEIMAIVFEMSKDSITSESSQDSIRNWDSVKHLDLIISLEEEFEITFPVEEIGHLVSFKIIKIIIEEQLELQ